MKPCAAAPIRQRPMHYVCLVLAVLVLSGCASQPANLTDPVADPWESFNRKMHKFNMGFDKVVSKPVAKGYNAVLPETPKRAVRNFFKNLWFPVTFVNLILQGKFEESMEATGRFFMNSTIGLGGLIDVASKADVPYYDEDFGQTLAVWGWKESRYLVVPFLGPFTVRDLGGRGVVGYFSPTAYFARRYNNYAPLIVDLISLRADLLPFDREIEASNDPYVLIRDAYLQNREYKIYDGNPPTPDYDALLEE